VIDLAYLVAERSPLHKNMHRILLWLALAADRRDIAESTPGLVARAMKVGLNDTKLTLKNLEAAGWIVPVSQRRQWRGEAKHYSLVSRSQLPNCPRLPIPKHQTPSYKFSGELVTDLETYAARDAQQAASQLEAFLALSLEDRLKALAATEQVEPGGG
jgi:hypothetical protein